MSGLDDLKKEELIALVIKLHDTVEMQKSGIAGLEAIAQAQSERISELEEVIARLKGGKSGLMQIKASVKKKDDKQPRKNRSSSFARKSIVPTEVVCHAVDRCPDCGRKLAGGTVKWKHQVIDIPAAPVKVTDHLFIERRCGVCGKRSTPDAPDALGDMVVGKKSIGIGLMSLIAYLKISCRVPVGLIRQLLDSLYGLKVSNGEICELLHEIARIGKADYDELLESVRGSPVVHGDETGWREDGVNGYLWSFSTPRARYFTYNHSRAGAVVKEVLERFVGALVADFYGGYNIYDGVKQRCWIHFLRDLKALAEKYESVAPWVESVKDIYYRAKATVELDYTDNERCKLRQGFESELLALAEGYLGVKSAPQRVLAQRIDRFLDELFPFVQYPEIPSENNAAERAVRPAVIARKISGGTRSAKGSHTHSVLRSLFETWALQGQNTIVACREMIVRANRKYSHLACREYLPEN
ncbi:MAG: IS66 family transposase [Armatimonadota bacterium]|nr:IS66 family transposase [Armatimonadota bacterium]